MFRFFISTFIVLHGLVHLWYFTLSQRLIAVTAEMGWSGESWLFSPLLGSGATRSLGSVLYVIVTAGFVVGGIGLFARTEWAQPVLVGAALLSAGVILIFWEGGLNMWMEKGMIGVVINVALLVAFWLVQ